MLTKKTKDDQRSSLYRAMKQQAFYFISRKYVHDVQQSPLTEFDVDVSQTDFNSTPNERDTSRQISRFLEPRFVGEVESGHLTVPRLSKISFSIAKRKNPSTKGKDQEPSNLQQINGTLTFEIGLET
ncbi:hypothetical protein NQ318_000077 [Aromia moschata]|uniref:Uncharacterized protein n=1 Tax=Aromia moschata TaxID=1265417 RepID=A0AAV8YDL5_9CUCU|nr:hypothetical protein NQ318_000077 [Aromia moschata]